MDLDRAMEYTLDGKALLFTGAGFSRGAVNLRNQQFKTGGQLAAHISKIVGLEAGTPLDDATDEFLDRFGGERLIKELEMEFTASKVSKAHLQFAQIPWKRIYTTNYDNVLEHSFAQSQQRLRPVTLSEQIFETPKDCAWCVHLNGFIGKLTLANISSEVKLTDTSYLTATLAESPWATVFREDLALASAVFFVGYSMADLDIKWKDAEQRAPRTPPEPWLVLCGLLSIRLPGPRARTIRATICPINAFTSITLASVRKCARRFRRAESPESSALRE
ncbi:MAG TPA: SIR2 family protein [Candidatus Acidoferrum sp.]